MENNKQEELDIISIARVIHASVKSFLNSISSLFRFSIKNLPGLLVFTLVSGGLFLGLYFAKKPVYTTSMALSHIRVENDYIYQMIKNLDNSIDGRSNEKLAAQLSLAPSDAEKIISIEYLPLNDNISRRFADSVRVLLPFKILVEVDDTEVLDSLETKLFNYLENNEYAQKLKQLDDEALNITYERLTKEIRSIDSLKTLVEQSIMPRSQGNGIILGEPINPVDIYRESVTLFEKKVMVTKAMKSNETFEIRVGFPKFTKRSDMGPIVYAGIGVLLGYLVGLMYLLRKARTNKTNSPA